jgi:NAD(P)-dependent dehydrogenase (short-subunit alcohol dehydrogenase family)
MRLDGKTAIITGGGGAMGGAQAKLFAKEGACVCVADFNLKMAQKVVDDIVAADGKAIAGDLDVRNPDQWLDTITLTEETFCSVDILCNNAGANFRVGFDNQTLEQWHTIIDTGLTGAFLGIKAVIPAMRRSGGGVILNMGSLASIVLVGLLPHGGGNSQGCRC